MKQNQSLTYAFSFLLLIFFNSCNFFSKPDNQNKYLAVKLKKSDSKISIIDTDGKIVLEDEFSKNSNIYISNDIITETTENGDVKYWKIKSNKVYQIGEEKYNGGTPFSQGYAIVRNDKGMLSLINEDAEEVVTNLSKINEYTIVRVASPSDDLMRFKTKEGLWGYLNVKGEIVIGPKYISCDNFMNGYARVLELDGTFNVIDKKGNVKYKGKEGFSYMPMIEDMIPFREEKSDFWGVINLKGEKIIKDNKFENIGIVSTAKHLVVSKGSGQWGVVDFKGEVIGELRTKFDVDPVITDEGMIIINTDKEPKLYDDKGKLIKKFDDFNMLLPISDDRYLGKQKNNKFVIINSEGKELSQDDFYLGDNELSNCVTKSSTNWFSFYKNQTFTIESKYFEFDEIFKNIFINISVNGISGVTANSNIESILKTYPYSSSSRNGSASDGMYVSKSNDYSLVMTYESKKKSSEADANEKNESRTEPTETTEATVDTAAAYPATDVPAYNNTPVTSIKDNYPFLSEYSEVYSVPEKYSVNVGYGIQFYFDQYLKQPITGTDPIFTNIITTIGYSLNNQAKLNYIRINLEFNDVDRKLFWNEFMKKAESVGFVKENDSVLIHKLNKSRAIYISDNYLNYFFNYNK